MPRHLFDSLPPHYQTPDQQDRVRDWRMRQIRKRQGATEQRQQREARSYILPWPYERDEQRGRHA